MSKERVTLKANKERALSWLKDLSQTSPLKRWLLQCMVCGKDSEGTSRCEKHFKRYSEVFYATQEAFFLSFGDQR